MATRKPRKKYALIKSDKKSPLGNPLFQVKALVDFSTFKKGEIGGYVEKEANLSQDGDAWVSGDARVFGDASVYGDASVFGDAWVFGDARVSGDAWVSGDARVFGDAWVSGRFNLKVSCDVEIPRIVIDTKPKLDKLLKFLSEF